MSNIWANCLCSPFCLRSLNKLCFWMFTLPLAYSMTVCIFINTDISHAQICQNCSKLDTGLQSSRRFCTITIFSPLKIKYFMPGIIGLTSLLLHYISDVSFNFYLNSTGLWLWKGQYPMFLCQSFCFKDVNSFQTSNSRMNETGFGAGNKTESSQTWWQLVCIQTLNIVFVRSDRTLNCSIKTKHIF